MFDAKEAPARELHGRVAREGVDRTLGRLFAQEGGCVDVQNYAVKQLDVDMLCSCAKYSMQVLFPLGAPPERRPALFRPHAEREAGPCTVHYPGKFECKGGYNGRPPGAAVVFVGSRVVSAEREAYYHRRGQLVGGRILAGDTS